MGFSLQTLAAVVARGVGGQRWPEWFHRLREPSSSSSSLPLSMRKAPGETEATSLMETASPMQTRV